MRPRASPPRGAYIPLQIITANYESPSGGPDCLMCYLTCVLHSNTGVHYVYYLLFVDENPKAQRGGVLSPKSHSHGHWGDSSELGKVLP